MLLSRIYIKYIRKLFSYFSTLSSSIYRFFDEKDSPSYIDFLTGLRGTLALSVICNHTANAFKSVDTNIFKTQAHFYGVYGFFFLSSFLLTYRLYGDFSKTNGSLIEISLKISTYFIRRFFRIYVPFVVYCTMVTIYPKFGNHLSWNYTTWTNLTTLHYPGRNHLWTIPTEIKYYLIIPFLTLLFYKIKKFSWLALLILFSFTFFYDKIRFNIFPYNYENFITFLPVFIKGSLIGIIYFKIERISILDELRKKYLSGKFFAYPLALSYYLIFRNSSRLLAKPKKFDWDDLESINYFSYSWTILLLCMLLSAPNRFTNAFKTQFLRKCGKFAYGIYLWHSYAIVLSKDYMPTSNSGFESIFLTVLIAYFLGKIFYYLIEYPLIKLSSILCAKVLNLSLVKSNEYQLIAKNFEDLVNGSSTILVENANLVSDRDSESKKI